MDINSFEEFADMDLQDQEMADMNNNEKLENALVYVSNGWFPPQQEVIQRTLERFEAGVYETDREELLKDLKSDLSLFTYFVRELRDSEAEGPNSRVGLFGEDLFPAKAPKEIIADAQIEKIREIFQSLDSEISSHSIEAMNHFQALRLRESVLSASTAEVLAESCNIDPELGFSCGVMRQLGLTLIAWNYPRVYSRAVELLQADETLDQRLMRVLGFSPSLLGVTLARKWKLSKEVLAGMGHRERRASDDKDAATQQVGDTLAKLCEVGEAFARANDPEHYPTALHDWERAEQVITAQLGRRGLQTILDRAQGYCQAYLKYAPEALTLDRNVSRREVIVNSHYAKALLSKNIHLRHCPDDLKASIIHLYAQLRPDQVKQENLREFLFHIVPQAGFERGCIFMLEPGKRVLSPVIRLGDVRWERQKPVILSTVLSQFDLVASAFQCKSPLREEHVDEERRPVTVIAGSVGEIMAIGVLYLETVSGYADKHPVDSLLIFRALRQCLNDCLNLS